MPRRGGPRPKDADQLVNPSSRRDRKAAMQVVVDEPVGPPDLPDNPFYEEWPEQTARWWDSWINNPLTDDYRESDWLDLVDCAVIHSRLWSGEIKAAAELRLRMARHGATREDRARLRITFAQADSAERRASEDPEQGTRPPAPPSRARQRGLRAVE